MNRADADLEESLREQVLAALARDSTVRIVGGDSKSFYGRPGAGEMLQTSGHRGVLSYEPTELVLTARSGTPLAEIETVLAQNGQMLAFEPPHFGKKATLGGAIAAGLSGPRRPYAGSARDAVLGCKILNGRGEILSFGGTVMKNVAGFDVPRLMVGAMGTLGLVLETSLKVSPRPQSEVTLIFELTAPESITALHRWSQRNWPLSGACHDGRHLYVRVSGAETVVDAASRDLGGEVMNAGDSFWSDLREHRLEFFAGEGDLWRFAMAPAGTTPTLPGEWLIEWGGVLRWLKSDLAADVVFEAARAIGGHATLFRSKMTGSGQVFQPLPSPLKALHLSLKRAFDPKGIFNRGRMYEEW